MMRNDKQFCLQLQLPRKSYLERHKIHENDNKTPNYNFESTHPNHTPDMDSSQIIKDHYNNWDTRTPNPITHPSNMRLYHESHDNALTVQSTRHHQYEVMANHHQLYSGITAHCQDTPYVPQFGTPVDTGIQLQPSWYPGNQNPIASSSSTYAQTSLYEDWNRHFASRPHFSMSTTDMPPFASSSLSPTQDNSQYQDHRSPPQELIFSSSNNNVNSNITDLTHSVSPVSCDGMSSSDSRDMIHHHSPGQMQHGLIREPVELNQFDCIKKNSYQMQCNGGRTRTKDKYRVVYSEVQRIELEKEFYRSRYITMKRKTELAQLFGLSERQVKIWFQNRRAKERKQVKKQEQELVRNERETDFVNQHHQMQMNIVNGSWE